MKWKCSGFVTKKCPRCNQSKGYVVYEEYSIPHGKTFNLCEKCGEEYHKYIDKLNAYVNKEMEKWVKENLRSLRGKKKCSEKGESEYWEIRQTRTYDLC